MPLNHINAINTYRTFFVLLALLCISPNVIGQNQRSDLQDVQQLIEQTKAQLSKNLKTIDRLEQELKLSELEIAKTVVLINETKNALNITNQEILELEDRQDKIEGQIKEQQTFLGNQIKSAFMAGNYDYAKILFNQDEANKLERVLVYYKYMNTARQKKIDGFRVLISELNDVVEKLSVKRGHLAKTKAKQEQQHQMLSDQQGSRLVSMQKLNRAVENDQSRVTRLQQQERDLVRAIEQAELAAKRLREQQTAMRNLSGLTGKQGQLAIPTSGRMRALFGKKRQGLVNWQGVMFNSPSGAPVQAVAEGKVLYADWLKGFGLVIIVDHGAGYMSVYGHNQALLKSVGDYVGRGESISLVGASGGQGNSGLYFELRHKGKALNPSNWIRRS
ncbi:MAG: peptidoglycan DD-metalloendopeptidase family protein [Pseudomonadota bacterium]